MYICIPPFYTSGDVVYIYLQSAFLDLIYRYAILLFEQSRQDCFIIGQYS